MNEYFNSLNEKCEVKYLVWSMLCIGYGRSERLSKKVSNNS